MAKIISSRKKYVPVKDLKVYPSNKETIEVLPDDGFNGAHRYRAQMCAGFVNGKAKYVDATDTIQFVHKHEDGTVTPGWQSEQLALILLDRVKKLNEKFPCEQNAKQVAALEAYLDACKERVDDRINRNVMGDLKE